MVLVTGGSGLVGEELIRQLLAKGNRVRALVNRSSLGLPDSPLLERFTCDILDVVGLEEAMTGISEVYHCAGMVSFDPRDVSRLYKVNTEGTANVVNAALDAGVARFCFVSSVAALGRIRNNEVVNESMNWTKETSNSRYGQSKYLAELEVWRGIAEGLSAVIVNPSIILGPGDWNSGSSAIFKSAFNEFPWYSEGITGFVDVRDLCAAMIGLMEAGVSGEKFIISAHNATYAEVFSGIAKAMGRKPPTKKVTAFIASIVWRLERIKSIFTGRKPLLTKETAATALAEVQYDNNKLFSFLPGFTYRPLEQTISETSAAILSRNR